MLNRCNGRLGSDLGDRKSLKGCGCVCGRVFTVLFLLIVLPAGSSRSQFLNRNLLEKTVLNPTLGQGIGIYQPYNSSGFLVSSSDSIIAENRSVKRKFTERFTGKNHFYYLPLNKKLENVIENFFQNRLKDFYLYREKKESLLQGKKTGSGSLLDISIPVPFKRQMDRYFGGVPTLKISGSQKVIFSGKSEWVEGDVETAANKNSTFPTMTMEQIPNFNINGKIGSKMDVRIAQNIEQLSNLEDNIKLTYKGNEDEILTSVEAGNTVLSLPGTFSSYSTGHPVFGIKTETTFGPLKLITIASQEKSESYTRSFKGQIEESSVKIFDYDIKRNTYFFLDKYYRDQFLEARDSYDRISFLSQYEITEIEVFIDDQIMTNNARPETFAIPGWAAPGYIIESEEVANPDSIEGYFHRLEVNFLLTDLFSAMMESDEETRKPLEL